MFLVLIFTRDLVDPRAWYGRKDICHWKKPVTPTGIDPGTVRLVAQHPNNYATLRPHVEFVFNLIASFHCQDEDNYLMPVYKIETEFISHETTIFMFLSCLLYTNNVSAAYPECEDGHIRVVLPHRLHTFVFAVCKLSVACWISERTTLDICDPKYRWTRSVVRIVGAPLIVK